MKKGFWTQKITSVLLAATLIFSPVTSVLAEEITDTTVSESEMTEMTEELPDEVTADDSSDSTMESMTESAEDESVEESLSSDELFGTEDTGSADSEIETFSYVNPLYQDLVGTEDLEPLEAETVLTAKNATTCTTMEAAAAQVRSSLVNRTSKITVVYNPGKTLSTEARKSFVYDLMDEAFEHTGVPTEGDYLLWQYAGWNVGISAKGTAYTVTYAVTYYTSKTQEDEVTEKVNQIYSDLNLTGKNDYQKLRAIYQYICDHVIYDYDAIYNPTKGDYTPWTAYGAACEECCVCQGYAVLLYRIALMAGIDTRVVTSSDHAWNIAKIGNYYYNLDSTWDAGTDHDEYDYFLLDDNTFTDDDSHVRESPYNEEEFYALYPMAASRYCEGGTQTPAANRFPHSGNLTSTISWTYEDGTLTIIGTGEIPDYGYDADDNAENAFVCEGMAMAPWYGYAGKIKSIQLSEGITSLGDLLFYECSSVTSVTFPSTLKSVGDFTFAFCNSLRSLSLNDGLVSIGEYAFYDCSLTQIEIPGSVTYIGDTSIGYKCFYGLDWYYSVSNFVIYGKSGSAAQNYAEDNSMKFKILLDPTAVQVLKTSYNTVTLTWSAVTGASGYEIFRSTSENGTYSKVGTVSNGKTVYSNLALTTGKTYYYRVRAYAGSGSSKYYGKYSSVISATPVLSDVANVSIGTVTYNKIQVKWTKISGASGYYVYANNVRYVVKGGSTSSYTCSNLQTDTEYTIRVQAYRTASKVTTASKIVNAGTATPKLSVPAGFVVSNGTSSVKLSWKAVSGATGYLITRSDGVEFKVTGGTKTSYTDQTLSDSHFYQYKLRAYRNQTTCCSNDTDEKSGNLIPSTPVVTLTAGKASATIGWKSVSSVQGYEIYRSTSKSGTYTLIEQTSALSYNDSALSSKKTYYYKVRSYRIVDGKTVYSAYSAVKSIKTK